MGYPFWMLAVAIVASGRVVGSPLPLHRIVLWSAAVIAGALIAWVIARHMRELLADGTGGGFRVPQVGVGVALGSGWAALPWIAWSDDPVNRFVMFALMVAAIISILARYLATPIVYRAGLATILTSALLRFAVTGDLVMIAAACVLLIVTVMHVIDGEALVRDLREARRLRLCNEALAQSLEAARDAEASARQLAEHQSQTKSEFLSHMTHELRTPLNAVIGFSYMLRSGIAGELNPRQSAYVHDIHESGRHLLALVNDVLDLAKIEAGAGELHLEPVALDDVIDGAMRLVAPRAASSRIVLARAPSSSGAQLIADPLRLKQVLTNLLSNAVKFSNDGGTVTVETEREGDMVRVSVVDGGIGMAPEDVPRALERFRQLPASGDRRSEGSGLGLAIARDLVEMHGGRMTVLSALNVGTRVIVELPSHGPTPAERRRP
jgi:signal transduction histidine kinase